MNTDAFREWLKSRFTGASAGTRLSCARTVEEHYGDLDEHVERDRCQSLLESLSYSIRDSRSNVPNPTKIPINGNPYNVLNNYKTGVRSYLTFIDEGGAAEVATEKVFEQAVEALVEKREGLKFELEAQMQASLREEITQLEPELRIVDGGSERAVASGQIDILAEDGTGSLVVIEIKKGLAKREAIGQIAGYMGDLLREETGVPVRGILVASEFDKSCRSSVAAIPSLTLRKYRFQFTFEEVS
ncbi:MAG: hypothetical protein RL490_183 [Pseudomonadota bacterium]|jgi:hypothetical protein